MPSRPSLREILRLTLAGSALAIGAVSCGQPYSGCGSQVIIVDANPVLPDGGLDCSACDQPYDVSSCNTVMVDGQPKLACNVTFQCL